ncbi:MAG: hypothetical protein ACYTFF_07910 [Planctomycetota bacterium]
MILALGLVITMPGAMANDDGDDLGGGLGFGQRVAGTYLDEGELLGGAISWIGVQTLGADGTVVTTNTNCCGAAGNLQSPGHGVWERTGIRQITLTALIFIQNWFPPEDCPLGCEGGDGSVLVGRPTIVLDFDGDFETAMGTINTALFTIDQDADFDGVLDYVDPDGVPFFCLEGTDDFTRVHVAPLCGGG